MDLHDASLYVAPAALIYLIVVVVGGWFDKPPKDNHDER